MKTPTTSTNEKMNRRSKKTRRLLVSAVAGALLLSACGTEDVDTAAVRVELTQFNDQFNVIAHDYDVDALVSLYADDAVWIAPATPPAPGQELASQTFQFLTDNRGFLSHTIDDLIISDDGNQAVMRGEADVLVEEAGLDITGTYLFVLEREDEDDEWQIAIDMFNQYAPDATAD